METRVREACSVVGVTYPPIDLGEVKRAYKRSSLRCHPDMGGTNELFSALSDAYRFLVDFMNQAPCYEPEPDAAEPSLGIGDLIPIIGIRCAGRSYSGRMRCSIDQIRRRDVDKYGQKTVYRLCIAIQFFDPVVIEGSMIEIALAPEPGEKHPDVIIRKIVQRSVDSNGGVTWLATDAMRTPVIEETYDTTHGFYIP